jgi:Pentapeptide repeats (8 copies)
MSMQQAEDEQVQQQAGNELVFPELRPGDAWGESITKTRVLELETMLRDWEAGKVHDRLRGPFDRKLGDLSWEGVSLSGADVFWLAARAIDADKVDDIAGRERLYVNNYRLDRVPSLASVQLYGANLSGAHLEQSYLCGIHLEGAQLEEAHLEGCILGLEFERDHARLHNLPPESFPEPAHLDGANLRYAHLVRRSANTVGIAAFEAAVGFRRSAPEKGRRLLVPVRDACLERLVEDGGAGADAPGAGALPQDLPAPLDQGEPRRTLGQGDEVKVKTQVSPIPQHRVHAPVHGQCTGSARAVQPRCERCRQQERKPRAGRGSAATRRYPEEAPSPPGPCRCGERARQTPIGTHGGHTPGGSGGGGRRYSHGDPESCARRRGRVQRDRSRRQITETDHGDRSRRQITVLPGGGSV